MATHEEIKVMSSDIKVIEMPDQLDELSMANVKGGNKEPDKPQCCDANHACNVNNS